MDGWLIIKALHPRKCILLGTTLRINSEFNVRGCETHVAAKQSVRYLWVDLDKSLYAITEDIIKKGRPNSPVIIIVKLLKQNCEEAFGSIPYSLSF